MFKLYEQNKCLLFQYRTERTATIESRSQREITVPYSPQSIDYDQVSLKIHFKLQ